MNRINRIKSKLAVLNPRILKITDESVKHIGHFGNNSNQNETHLNLEISSSELEGKTKIQQHRLINNLLQDEFNNGLHALSIIVY